MPAYNWSLPSATTEDTGLSAYGPDVTTWAEAGQTEPDLDPFFTEIDGPRCIAEGLARRLCSPRGSLDGSPNDGEDIRARVSRLVSSREVFDIQVAIQREAAKDERVKSAYVSVEWQPAKRTLLARVTVEPMVGETFKFTLAIGQVAIALGVA